MEMCPKKRFAIGKFHHITIKTYNDFTILPYWMVEIDSNFYAYYFNMIVTLA